MARAGIVGLGQGDVRQVRPDDGMLARIPGPVDRRTGISPLPQGFREPRREMPSALHLRRYFRMSGPEQMPEEPERELPLAPSGPPAGPGNGIHGV